MIESTIEQHGDQIAKERGFLVRKAQWVGRKGAPDKFYSRADTGPFMVEYKRPGKKPDPIQQREIRRLREHGTVVYSVATKQECEEVFPCA